MQKLRTQKAKPRHLLWTCCSVSKLTTRSYNQALSTVPQWCYSNTKGANPDIVTQNKGFHLQFPPIACESHAPLQRFAWCIASLVLQLF